MTQLGMFFRDRNRALRIWQALAVCGFVAVPVGMHLTEETCSREARYFAMDSQGYYYVSHACTFEKAPQIHRGVAEDAAMAMFSRSPTMFNQNAWGFDLPEGVERMFDIKTAKDLRDEATRDAAEFKAQQIWQSPFVEHVDEKYTDKNMVEMIVDVMLAITSTDKGHTTTSSRHVRVFLTLVRNDNMATNGRTPLVVISYEKKFL